MVSDFRFWELTSPRTCPGVWTQRSWQWRLSRDFISWESSGQKHPSKAADVLLSMFCWEHPVLLPLCLVFQLHNSAEETLQGIVKTAQGIINCSLPSLDEQLCLRKARNIMKDSSHHTHNLLQLLPSGKKYSSIKKRTNRLNISFYPVAVSALNYLILLQFLQWQ